MANASGNQLSVGIRYASIFELNADGRPAAVDATTVYSGLQVQGARAFTVTTPEPRRINHSGDDRLLAQDTLPALEGITAELRVAKGDLDVLSKLMGVKVETIGEAKAIQWATEQQGFEPQVGLLLYQQSLDSDPNSATLGLRNWRSVWIPKAKLTPALAALDENPSEYLFRVTAYTTKAQLWGTAFTIMDNGALEAQAVEMQSVGKPALDSWVGDAAETQFALAHTALSTAKVSVFVDGVKQTVGTTVTTTSVTFGAPPASGADICVLYEW